MGVREAATNLTASQMYVERILEEREKRALDRMYRAVTDGSASYEMLYGEACRIAELRDTRNAIRSEQKSAIHAVSQDA